MGSAEESTAPSKPPNPKTTRTTSPPPATAQEPPATPSYSSDWAAAVQAYYSGAAAAATPPPFFSPPVWGSQHLISPYGTPIPYSPMYHHPVYAHPSMAAAAAVYPAAESGSNKSKGGSGKSGEGGKVTSGSADEYGSQSGGESGSEGSSGTRDDSAEPQDVTKKRTFGDAFAEGETSQPATAAQNNGTTAESPYSGRARTVTKLPVSAPGRAALPGPATNLNMGMDLWNASPVGTVPVKSRPNSVNIAATVGANGVLPEHHWIQQDERELKRERRKQSNRESARRSRLRKQQECEDLARKVTELSGENNTLKLELEQLNKVCKDLEAENASIMEELNRLGKTSVVAPEGINCNSVVTSPSAGGEGSAHVPQNSVGSNGKHNSNANLESASK